jgi:hypothetical protein
MRRTCANSESPTVDTIYAADEEKTFEPLRSPYHDTSHVR